MNWARAYLRRSEWRFCTFRPVRRWSLQLSVTSESQLRPSNLSVIFHPESCELSASQPLCRSRESLNAEGRIEAVMSWCWYVDPRALPSIPLSQPGIWLQSFLKFWVDDKERKATRGLAGAAGRLGCSFPSDALRRLQTESQSEEERVVEVLRRGSEPGKERFTTESVVSCFCPVYFCVQFPWWQQISSSSHAAQTLSGFIIQLILDQILHSFIVIQICQTFISSNVSSVFLSLL